MYIAPVTPILKPSKAWSHSVSRNTERVNVLDLTTSHVTASLVTPYPPGIPLLIPGEQFNQEVIDYLRFALEFNGKFPGFEQDVHGLVKEKVDGELRYYVDCVKL